MSIRPASPDLTSKSNLQLQDDDVDIEKMMQEALDELEEYHPEEETPKSYVIPQTSESLEQARTAQAKQNLEEKEKMLEHFAFLGINRDDLSQDDRDALEKYFNAASAANVNLLSILQAHQSLPVHLKTMIQNKGMTALQEKVIKGLAGNVPDDLKKELEFMSGEDEALLMDFMKKLMEDPAILESLPKDETFGWQMELADAFSRKDYVKLGTLLKSAPQQIKLELNETLLLQKQELSRDMELYRQNPGQFRELLLKTSEQNDLNQRKSFGIQDLKDFGIEKNGLNSESEYYQATYLAILQLFWEHGELLDPAVEFRIIMIASFQEQRDYYALFLLTLEGENRNVLLQEYKQYVLDNLRK